MYKFPTLRFLTYLCLIILALGCGGDDEPNDTTNEEDTLITDVSASDGVDIVGTWKLISVEPQVVGLGDLPEQILIINADGTWNSTTIVTIPILGVFTVTAMGTYTFSEDKLLGEIAEVQTEPDIGLPLTVNAGLTGETTVKRESNRLILISSDETSGETTITVYEKQ